MTLLTYYQLNFSMKQFHNWSISEINDMYPYERDFYGALLENHLKEQEEKRKQQG